ncbi:hypothetical protein N9850_14075 [Granulosicoccus sp.]|nr:hypothetical protein [Granulosicoccus sp.]MDB4224889.1 hypothetical protein [Granulosicoccus sp.]
MTKEIDDTSAELPVPMSENERISSEGAVPDPRSSLNFRESLIHDIGNRLFTLLIIFLLGMGTWSIYAYTRGYAGDAVLATVGNAPSASLLPVLFAGILGGILSLQKRFSKLPISDLMLLRNSISHLLLAPLVGGFLATMLYVLFIAGLLEGEFFPRFSADSNISTERYGMASLLMVHGDTYKDYAKLFFWCFLAGYSERFITKIFGQFEGGVDQPYSEEGSKSKAID